MFRPTNVVINTAVQNVLIEYICVDRNDIWYVCCLWVRFLVFGFG